MGNNLSAYLLALRDRQRTLAVLAAPEFEKERKTSLIIRTLHSIEKGLCLENPRLGFGVAKLNKLFSLCRQSAEAFGPDQFCLKMARDVVKAYIDFHQEKGYHSEDFQKICDEYAAFPCKNTEGDEVYGGTLEIEGKSNLSLDELEAFLSARHSIRDFDRSEVSEQAIKRAIHTAQFAPSACNRQAVRAYVLPAARVCEFYSDDLTGIGGFAESADKFIFITGKLSAYDRGENNQYIVSASIFAAYLVEALFAQNIGACMVQRPLYYSTRWHNISKEIGVPADERLVMMIAIGNMKEKYTVPVSKRFPTDEIVKFIR